jgi:hypothetical protein
MSAQLAGWLQAVRSLGIPIAKDQGNGKNVGVSYIASTIDPASNRRKTSVGYLDDNAIQANLVVLTNSHVCRLFGSKRFRDLDRAHPFFLQVTRINWLPFRINGNVVASGVTFVGGDGLPVNVVSSHSWGKAARSARQLADLGPHSAVGISRGHPLGWKRSDASASRALWR